MESLGLTLFVIFFVYLVLGMPLAICLGLSVITTFWYHDALPLMAVAQKLYNGLEHFALMAIPFFILASNLMSSGGVSKRLIDLCNAFVGHYRGGLAVAAIISCMFFAAISGSSPSTVVAIGTIMIPAMIASGYSDKYSVGLLGSAGSLGILIPPSIPMIVYGVATDQSVGKLFMAGVGPGLFMGGLFIITAVIYARVKGFKGGEPMPWKDRLVLLWKALPGLFMPFLILGGIYGGVFTPTEAAAVANDGHDTFHYYQCHAFCLHSHHRRDSCRDRRVYYGACRNTLGFPSFCQYTSIFCGRLHGTQRSHSDFGTAFSAHRDEAGYRSDSFRDHHDREHGDRNDNPARGSQSFRGQWYLGPVSLGCFQRGGTLYGYHADRSLYYYLYSDYIALVPQTSLWGSFLKYKKDPGGTFSSGLSRISYKQR